MKNPPPNYIQCTHVPFPLYGRFANRPSSHPPYVILNAAQRSEESRHHATPNPPPKSPFLANAGPTPPRTHAPSNSHAYPNTLSNTYTPSNSDSHPHAHAYPNTHTYPNTNPNPHTPANAHSYPNSHSNTQPPPSLVRATLAVARLPLHKSLCAKRS